jgi:hypothetical protein
MTERPLYDELAKRIVEHIDNSRTDKALVSACWHGYLAALLEWGLITPEDHARLIRLLPPLDPNPVLQIFLGN